MTRSDISPALIRAARAARSGRSALGRGIDRGGDAASLADASDVLVDFSSPQALDANLHAAIGAGIPLVIGTTGLEERHHGAIDDAARAVAVLQTGNTSLGVTLLAHLVREAAERLGPDWDIEILEMHHRRKVDAPSGTALLLGEAAAAGRGVAVVSDDVRYGLRGLRVRSGGADLAVRLFVAWSSTHPAEASLAALAERLRTFVVAAYPDETGATGVTPAR